MMKSLVLIAVMVCSLYGGTASEGKALYAKCAGCHGNNGKHSAFGVSAHIAGRDVNDLKFLMYDYKNATYQLNKGQEIMKKVFATFDDEHIDSLAKYIATLK